MVPTVTGGGCRVAATVRREGTAGGERDVGDISVEGNDISHNSGNVAWGNNNTLNVNNNEGAVIFHGDVPRPIARALPISFIGQDFARLIGRERQLEKLLEGLSDSQSNRLELSAPDGWGKTVLLRRLAHAASGLSGEDGELLFPSGATKVSCAGLGLTDVLNTVHRQFFEPPLNHEAIYLDQRTITEQLKEIRALIILDDVELDAASAGQIYDLCSGSRFVIARQTAVLSPLDGASVRLRGLRVNEAVELFRAIADFEGETADQAAAEIVELLDRRPLTVMRVAQLAIDAAEDEGVDVDMVAVLDGLRSGSFSELGQLSDDERQTLGDVLSVTSSVPEPVVRLLPGDATVLSRPGFAGAAASPIRLDPELRDSIDREDDENDESHMRLLAAIGEWIDRGDAVIDDVRFVAGVLKEILPTARRLGQHDLAFTVIKKIDPLMSKSGMVGLWNDLAVEAVEAAGSLGSFERAWAAMQSGATSLAKGRMTGDIPLVGRLEREWAARRDFSTARRLFKSLGSASGVAKARHNMFVASRLLYALLGSAAALIIGGGGAALALQDDSTSSVRLETAGDWVQGDRVEVIVCGTPVVYVEGEGFSPPNPAFVLGCFAESGRFEPVQEIGLGPTGPGEVAARQELVPRNAKFRLRLEEPPPQAGNRLQVPENSTVVFEVLALAHPDQPAPTPVSTTSVSSTTSEGEGPTDTGQVPHTTGPEDTVPPRPDPVPGDVWTFSVELVALNDEADESVTIDFCVAGVSITLSTAGALAESEELPLTSQCWVALDEADAAHYELRIGDSFVGDQVAFGADRVDEVVEIFIVPVVERRTSVELEWSTVPDFETSAVPEFELRCDGELIETEPRGATESTRRMNFDVPTKSSCVFVSVGAADFRWRRRVLDQPFEPFGDVYRVTGEFAVPSWRVGVAVLSRFDGVSLTATGCGLPDGARVDRRTGRPMAADGDDTSCSLVVSGELPAGAVASYFIDDPREERPLVLGADILISAEDPDEVGLEAVQRVTIIVANTGDILEFESSTAGAPESANVEDSSAFAPSAGFWLECKNAAGEQVTSARMTMSLAENTIERRRSHAGTLDLSDCTVVHAEGSDATRWADFSVRRDQGDRPYFPATFKILVTRTFDNVTVSWAANSGSRVGDVRVACMVGDMTIASAEMTVSEVRTVNLGVPRVDPDCELVVGDVSGTATLDGARQVVFSPNVPVNLGPLADGQVVVLASDQDEVDLQVTWVSVVELGDSVELACGTPSRTFTARTSGRWRGLEIGTQCRITKLSSDHLLSIASSTGIVTSNSDLRVGSRFTVISDAVVRITSVPIGATAEVSFSSSRDGVMVRCGPERFPVPATVSVRIGEICVADDFSILDDTVSFESTTAGDVVKVGDLEFRVDGAGSVRFDATSGAVVTLAWSTTGSVPSLRVECGSLSILSTEREFEVNGVEIGSTCEVVVVDPHPSLLLRTGADAPIDKIAHHVFRIGGDGTIGLDLGTSPDMVCQSLISRAVGLHETGAGSFAMPEIGRHLIVAGWLVWAGGPGGTSLTLDGMVVPAPVTGTAADLTTDRTWRSWISDVTDLLRQVDPGTVEVEIAGWVASDGAKQDRTGGVLHVVVDSPGTCSVDRFRSVNPPESLVPLTGAKDAMRVSISVPDDLHGNVTWTLTFAGVEERFVGECRENVLVLWIGTESSVVENAVCGGAAASIQGPPVNVVTTHVGELAVLRIQLDAPAGLGQLSACVGHSANDCFASENSEDSTAVSGMLIGPGQLDITEIP